MAKNGFIKNLKKTSSCIMPMDIQYHFENNPPKELRDLKSLRRRRDNDADNDNDGRKTKPIGYGAKAPVT